MTALQEGVQVDLLEGGTVGDTAVISCADGERSMSGYSLPISFVIKSNSSKCTSIVCLLDQY